MMYWGLMAGLRVCVEAGDNPRCKGIRKKMLVFSCRSPALHTKGLAAVVDEEG